MSGHPLYISKLLAELDGTCYVTRQSVHNLVGVRKAKKAIRKGFENSAQKKGTSVVEVMGTCPSGWKLSPADSNTWMVENMFPMYPLGDLKDV
jgi:2-oxoglutarate ferredoxin oxidoreductase subunit beta